MADRDRFPGSVRRRLARWVAPELEEELAAARRELRDTRQRLTRTKRRLRDAQDRLSVSAQELPEDMNRVIAAVRDDHLTYLRPAPLRDLAGAVAAVERDGLPGVLVEAGTARGGSAIVIAAAKAHDRPLKVYDVFGMIPPPTEHDGADVHARYAEIAGGAAKGPGGSTYYGYRADLMQEVADAFARHGLPVVAHHVELIEGLFEDTLHLEEPVAFAHLDGDWYESTMTCLQRIAPRLVPGGRIVLDDYYAWSGCRRAVDEYFAAHDGFRLEQRARLHVVRV